MTLAIERMGKSGSPELRKVAPVRVRGAAGGLDLGGVDRGVTDRVRCGI